MSMLRRSFFSALLAPLLARFPSRPKAGERVFSDALLHKAMDLSDAESVTFVEIYQRTPSGQYVFLCSNPVWATDYFKRVWQEGRAPFVVFKPTE